jgi:predicted oxidoreductase (fatty acid repression mutant protein)
LYFDDVAIVEGLQKKFPLYADKSPVWAQQSNGILQYMIWTSLQAEGFGASLQHYNPLIDLAVEKEWKVPDKWILTAQMPFGVPVKDPDKKDKLPIEERFIMHN